MMGKPGKIPVGVLREAVRQYCAWLERTAPTYYVEYGVLSKRYFAFDATSKYFKIFWWEQAENSQRTVPPPSKWKWVRQYVYFVDMNGRIYTVSNHGRVARRGKYDVDVGDIRELLVQIDEEES